METGQQMTAQITPDSAAPVDKPIRSHGCRAPFIGVRGKLMNG